MPKVEMDKTGKIIIKICIFSIILSLTALILAYAFNKWNGKTSETGVGKLTSTVIIIDAGHGGEDGGATAPDGTKEKDINLSIALALGDMLKSSGFEVIQTRTDDRMLYTTKENGTLKMQDLANRLKVANSDENCIFISIHANKFSQSKYSGTQTFYSKNDPKSRELAQIIQKNIKNLLQNENNREIKEATSSIFLLDKAKNPAVLVECGFLSNPEECNKLKDETYRKELSSLIYDSVIEFFSQM